MDNTEITEPKESERYRKTMRGNTKLLTLKPNKYDNKKVSFGQKLSNFRKNTLSLEMEHCSIDMYQATSMTYAIEKGIKEKNVKTDPGFNISSPCEEGINLVTLNMRGYKYQMKKSSFFKLPIDNIMEMTSSKYFNKETNDYEYFIDRDASSFTAILEYVKTGELHMPSTICPNVFKKEMEFWSIDKEALSVCCFNKMIGFQRGINSRTII